MTLLTDQQAAAIRTRSYSVALSAGAGCGKTFVLTQRFLSHLEPGPDGLELHEIVAMTFTERAAREMRERMRGAVRTRLQNCPDDQVAHWLTTLRNLETARVTTIHAFCAGLLRTYAIEAGLDPRFTVLEPGTSLALVREQVREALYESLVAHDPAAENLVFYFGLEDTAARLESLVHNRFRADLSTQRSVTPSEWVERWQTDFLQRFAVTAIRDWLEAPFIQQLIPLLEEHVPANAKLVERRQRLLEVFQELAHNFATRPLAEHGADEILVSRWRTLLSAVGDNATLANLGRGQVWSDPETHERFRELLTKTRESARSLRDDLTIDPEVAALAARLCSWALQLTGAIVDRYSSVKRSRSAVDFDDLLLLTRDLLATSADVRIAQQRQIRLLMVDEFQDTDPVQAEIVRLLCGEALLEGKLFLVGDVKQSIYRFRRADPLVFRQLRNEIPPAGRLPLSTNFRSRPEILRFVNLLFSTAMGTEYEPLIPPGERSILSAGSPKANAALTAEPPDSQRPLPRIEFLFASPPQEEPSQSTTTPENGNERPSDQPPQRTSARELRQHEAAWIAGRIAELLADPTPRIRTDRQPGTAAPDRRVEPGDIVILFRALSDVQEYEQALQSAEIDYYLVGGRAFYAQQEIFDLVNLCRFLSEPTDEVALVGVLRSPFFSLDDETLHRLGTQPASLSQSLFDSALRPQLADETAVRVEVAANVLTRLRERVGRIGLGRLLELAVEWTGYDAALLMEHLGGRKVANLRKLIESARAYDSADSGSLYQFVEQLQEAIGEEVHEELAATSSEASRVVRIMTIHQSKGLEFPVVFVADINRQGLPRSVAAALHPRWGALLRMPKVSGRPVQSLPMMMFASEENQADQDEALRLFYVATTRAADLLILSAAQDPAGSRSPSLWWNLVSTHFDVRTGLLYHDTYFGSQSGPAVKTSEIPDVLVHRRPPGPSLQSETEQRSAPPSIARSTSASRPIRIEDLPLAVVSAEPTPVPLAIRCEHTGLLPFVSVSQLEAIDAALGRRQTIPIDGTRDAGPSLPGRAGIFENDELPDSQHRPRLEDATGFGLLIHQLLEVVRFEWPLDELLGSAPVLRHLAAETEATRQAAKDWLTTLWNSPLLDELRSATCVQRERDFVLSWPLEQPAGQTATLTDTVVIRGQIDLLFRTAAGDWQIIDFKTGAAESTDSDGKLLAGYELQLAIYQAAVRQAVLPPDATCEPRTRLVFARPAYREVTLPDEPLQQSARTSRIHASIVEWLAAE